MAIIKKFSPLQNLSAFQVFINDTAPNSQYFKITEFGETLTGGKNGFLIEGSEFLRETTEVKIEILDVENRPIYYEPGDGVPEYYEGTSKLIAVHIYDDTPIGTGKITILGELKNYIDENGAIVPVPNEWRGIYNVKWEKTFQVNKNLSNETRVRFYQRPSVTISELVKPIFSKTVPSVTDTGLATGEAILPAVGTSLTNYRAGTSYRLTRSSGFWDRDVDENEISFSGLGYTSRVIEVLNDKQVLVNIPYSVNNIVTNFISQSYSITYSDFQNEIIDDSSLVGSFAKIDITKLKTFVGDVARVKVFRKSRNAVGDFQFVQESKLESSELLRDITVTSNTEIPYGRFDEYNLETYWVTESVSHPTTIDSSILSQAVKVDYNGSGVQKLITSQSFSLSRDVEYTLDFRTLLSGSISSDKYLKAYFSGSFLNGFGSETQFTQSFIDITANPIYLTRQNVSQNILAERDINAKLVFEFVGDDWYLSNVSLKNAQDTSFSPDEFTLIQDIPRKLASETFDFRFEFYDINNNYIPVDVTAVGVFDGGNDFPTSGKLFTFESDRNAFRFSSGSIGNPSFQQIQFKTTTQNLTGSITFASAAFDVNGNYIDPVLYSGEYPGFLTNITPAGAIVTLANFSGSDESYTVGSIIYTASIEDLQEFETVYRLEDGDNAPQLIVTSNANQFIYEPTTLSPKPSGQSITIRAQRKNLFSIDTPITINSSSDAPLTYVSTEGGIDTYTISATEFSASFANNPFPEVTYSFTGSDVFLNNQSDEITISPVINFDGISIVLSNENSSFPALSTGFVTSASLEASSGSVQMFIGGNQIQHDEGLGSRNRFDITNVVGTNCTPNNSNPITNEYGITTITSDSASLSLNITYKAGDNLTTQSFQKIVSYTKNKKAAPVLNFVIGNNNQTSTAKSTGEQIDSFVNATLNVVESYNGVSTNKTLVSAPTINSSSAYPTSPPTNTSIGLSNLPPNADSLELSITGSVVDSENVTRQVFGNISLSKSRKAVPNVLVIANPQSQTITSGSLTYQPPSPITISVKEGNTNYTHNVVPGITQFTLGGFTGPFTHTAGVITTTQSILSGSISGSALVSYVNSEGTSDSETISFSIGVAVQGTDGVNGAAGTNAKTVTLTSDQYIVQYNGDGVKTPVSITLTATQQNHNGTVFYQFLRNGSSVQNTTSNTYSIQDAEEAAADTADLWEVRTREGSNSGTVIAFDNTDIFGVQDGTNAITAFLTNEAHTLPTDTAGTVTYTGSGTSVIVFKGATELNGITSGTPTLGQFTVTTSVTTGTITVGGQSSSGNPMVFADHSNMTSDLAIIEYTINVENLVTLKKYQTLSKSKQGATGATGATGANGTNGLRTAAGMVHYQLTSTNPPSNPTATSYTFSNGTFSGLTANWGTGAPTYASGNTNKYWYATYTAVETSPGSGVGSVTFGNSTQAIGFSGLVSFTGASGVSDGSNSLTFGVTGTTLINGSNISTGKIISTNYSAGSPYTTAGSIIDLDNGRIATKTFYVDSNGDAVFKGTLSAAGGTFSGNLSAAGGTFSGNLSAAGGTFSGNLSAAGGTFNGSVSIGSGNSIFKADSNGIYLGNATFASAPFRVTPGGVLTSTAGAIGGWTIESTRIFNSGVALSTSDGGNRGLFIDNTSGGEAVAVHDGTSFRNATSTSEFSAWGDPGNSQVVSGPIFGQNTPSTAGYTFFSAFTSDIGVSDGGVIGITAGEINSLISQSPGIYWLNRGVTSFVQTYHWLYIQVYNSSNTFIGERIIASGYVNYNGSYDKSISNLGTASIVLSAGTYKTRIKHLIGVNFLASGDSSTLHDAFYGGANAVFATSGAGRSVELCQIGLKSTYGLNNFIVNTTLDGSDLLSVGGSSNFGGPATFTGIDASVIDVDSLTVGEISLRGGVLTVNGDIRATGDIYALATSDRRLKTNIIPINNSIDIIKKLNGYTFNWNEESNKSPDKQEIGVIAQEVQEVLPQLVGDKGMGYLGVEYDKIVAVLIEGIKEQQLQIENLENKIEELKKSIK